MVRRVAMSMVGGLIAAFAAITDPREVGDLTWSAKASKSRWLRCDGPGTGPASGSSTHNNTGGGGAHNNMQPFIAAHMFIYAGV